MELRARPAAAKEVSDGTVLCSLAAIGKCAMRQEVTTGRHVYWGLRSEAATVQVVRSAGSANNGLKIHSTLRNAAAGRGGRPKTV